MEAEPLGSIPSRRLGTRIGALQTHPNQFITTSTAATTKDSYSHLELNIVRR
ncbi:hypothetical protein VB638_15205 [Dolichospermum sp. UHCC 0684]|nr:hypothetical protein [Dolichospermum sp. UHCC 0684]